MIRHEDYTFTFRKAPSRKAALEGAILAARITRPFITSIDAEILRSDGNDHVIRVRFTERINEGA